MLAMLLGKCSQLLTANLSFEKYLHYQNYSGHIVFLSGSIYARFLGLRLLHLQQEYLVLLPHLVHIAKFLPTVSQHWRIKASISPDVHVCVPGSGPGPREHAGPEAFTRKPLVLNIRGHVSPSCLHSPPVPAI